MASTFERLFGSEGPAASNGASPQTGAQGRKSGSPDGQATGILPSQDEKFLGSGKRRLKERNSPFAMRQVAWGLGGIWQSQAWSGSPRSLGGSLESEDLKSSCGPVRRRFPSADKISVPLPPWAAPGELSPCVPPARDRSPRAQDRRVADWTHGYDLDAYRSIRVYPDSSHYKTCAALSKAYFEPQEHADLLGPDGMPRGACKRQGSPDARGTQSSITFTASGTSPEAGDNLQGMQTRMVGGDWNFSTLSPIPRKRLQSESPRQDEVPSAGRVSTRFSWAADMVPHSPQPKRNMRNMQSLESASPRSTAGTSLGTGLIRSSAALTTGFYAEEPDTLLDSFLGARKGRSPFASPSPGASPLTSPRSVSATPQSRGFGSLSWGHVSAGGYGPEVAARQAAGTSHRLWRPKDSDITTFKEPFLRHRERVRDQRARSPPRWK
ncbi:unnamed protein product [Effrenium voratum]|uniref:Uncharacterized protein n=1 Tax=Effrenium voratum TaxID=2562239 RepID=A0AA36J831_9DINO|nr:unnamed protein product [Effrenium voratum]